MSSFLSSGLINTRHTSYPNRYPGHTYIFDYSLQIMATLSRPSLSELIEEEQHGKPAGMSDRYAAVFMELVNCVYGTVVNACESTGISRSSAQTRILGNANLGAKVRGLIAKACGISEFELDTLPCAQIQSRIHKIASENGRQADPANEEIVSLRAEIESLRKQLENRVQAMPMIDLMLAYKMGRVFFLTDSESVPEGVRSGDFIIRKL